MLERKYIYARTGLGCLVGILAFGVAVSVAVAIGLMFEGWWLAGACFVGIALLLGRLVHEADRTAAARSKRREVR